MSDLTAALSDFKNGQFLIVTDDETRENEGDLILLAEKATTENLSDIGDLAGYKQDFLNLFGFGFEGVDYNLDTNEMVMIPSI